VFRFLERRLRLERRFKQAILLTTCAVVAVIVRVVPWGRDRSDLLFSTARQASRQFLAFSRPRPEIDEARRQLRLRRVEETRPRVARFFSERDEPTRRLLRYAGMDPEHGLLRWANVDWTILLSSRVFEPDDLGRSYRLRPRTRAIWLRPRSADLPVIPNAGSYFLVPDGPGLAEALRGTETRAVETSRQVTNAWGLRGPEPDPEAPLRGIVLGDSFMQGVFLGERDTPPECLRRYLEDRLRTRVSLLNTGVLGYSPEQYYHSLTAFAGRFRPHFVVVSVFPNDFGRFDDVVSKGAGDWEEGKYWLKTILGECDSRGCPALIVPAPYRGSVVGRRPVGYLDPLLKTLKVDSTRFLDPLDDFANAQLSLRREGRGVNPDPKGSPLFNDAIGDDHFSAAGSEVWAASVGERVILLLQPQRQRGGGPGSARESPPGPSRGERRRAS
jgi:hypothetical protein